MPSFDADAFAAAMEPPTMTVGGVTYTGRHLSLPQWVRAITAIDRANASGALLDYARAARIVFAAMYDPPRWQLWKPRPSRAIMAQPPAVWQQGMAVFFASPTTGVRPVTVATTPADPTTSPPVSTGAAPSPDLSANTDGEAGTPLATGGPGTA